MANFRLVLAYDGTRYHGWQKQGNTGGTVQEKLEAALSRILEQPVEAAGSGRTDAGAHARGQVVSFRANTTLPPEELLARLRRSLPEDIGALELTAAPPRFHARLSAAGKTYVYRVWNSECPNVFERRYVWQMPERLNLAAMEQAAQSLVGTHDFRAFCSSGRTKKSTVRTVTRLEICPMGEELRFIVSGDGFLYNMVRIMVGTLVEVGLGKRDAASVAAALAAEERALAGETAPARGLTLWEVEYR